MYFDRIRKEESIKERIAAGLKALMIPGPCKNIEKSNSSLH